MRFPVICVPFLPAAGMAFFPFILIKKLSFKYHRSFINHEKIHLVQQVELLLIGFYLLYIMHYVYNLFKYLNHQQAYMNIVFEKEAYTMELDHTYLQKRKYCNWVKFL